MVGARAGALLPPCAIRAVLSCPPPAELPQLLAASPPATHAATAANPLLRMSYLTARPPLPARPPARPL